MKITWQIYLMILILGLTGFQLEHAHAERPRSEVSLGFLTHRMGISFVDYHYIAVQTENHDISIGIGTILAYAAYSLGWKYYIYRGFADIYWTFALQYGSGMSKAPPKLIPFSSVGLEFQFWTNNYVNVGVNQWVTTRLTELNQTTMDDHLILPQLSWGWRW